jgi:hypothetical protein
MKARLAPGKIWPRLVVACYWIRRRPVAREYVPAVSKRWRPPADRPAPSSER